MTGDEHGTSDEEREGVPPDDMDARTPLGVGESMSRSGEDVTDRDETGRHRYQEDEDRPPATRPAPERTGINPQDPPDRS